MRLPAARGGGGHGPGGAARREVFFEVNSVPRVVEVLDRSEEVRGAPGRKAARERADTSNLGSVAAPMSGEVIAVKAKPGASRPPLAGAEVPAAVAAAPAQFLRRPGRAGCAACTVGARLYHNHMHAGGRMRRRRRRARRRGARAQARRWRRARRWWC